MLQKLTRHNGPRAEHMSVDIISGGGVYWSIATCAMIAEPRILQLTLAFV
jgi:hypothetical protein